MASSSDNGLRRTQSTIMPPKTNLTITQDILFTLLFMQAQDAASPTPILGDSYAQQYVNKVNVDFNRSYFITDPRTVKTFICRTKVHDQWLQHWLDIMALSKTPVTVVHIGARLDSRNMRINRNSSVRWIDVDTTEAIEFRRTIIPTPPGDYTTMMADFSDNSWIDEIPNDRPTYIVAEEFTMWQKPATGKAMFKRLVDHFPNGQIATDMIGSILKELHFLMPILKETGLKFEWAINDGREIEVLSKRLKLLEEVRWYDLVGAAMRDPDTPAIFGRWTSIVSRIPGFKNCAQCVLLDFGDTPASRSTMSSSMTEQSGLSDTSVTGVSNKGSSISAGSSSGRPFSFRGRYSPLPSRSSRSSRNSSSKR